MINPTWTIEQGQGNIKWATNIKIEQANTKTATKLKNGTPISKTVQAKLKNGTSQIEKWHKRSFYQGPGVKFPFSWEKITLPP